MSIENVEYNQKRFEEMEDNIAEIAEAQRDLAKVQLQNAAKLDRILIAIHGDEMGTDGFVKKLKGLTDELATLKTTFEKEILNQSTRKTVFDTYSKIAIFLLGIIATGIVGFLVNYITHKNT